MTDDVKDALETAREAFARVHRYATHQEGATTYMSIPADRKRDADLMHLDALDALEAHIDGESARQAAALETQLARLTRELSAEVATARENFETRLRAAVAAAREEQREADAKFCPNCLGVGFVERPVPCPYCDDSTHDHYCPTGTQRQQCGCGAARIRATPLTATPLADEIAALRAQVEAARTYARQSLDYGEDCDATDLLRAMDEAKP